MVCIRLCVQNSWDSICYLNCLLLFTYNFLARESNQYTFVDTTFYSNCPAILPNQLFSSQCGFDLRNDGSGTTYISDQALFLAGQASMIVGRRWRRERGREPKCFSRPTLQKCLGCIKKNGLNHQGTSNVI